MPYAQTLRTLRARPLAVAAAVGSAVASHPKSSSRSSFSVEVSFNPGVGMSPSSFNPSSLHATHISQGASASDDLGAQSDVAIENDAKTCFS